MSIYIIRYKFSITNVENTKYQVTWWQLIVLRVALQQSMAAMVKASIYHGLKVDMAASVDINLVAGCASSPTLLSFGAIVLVPCMEQTGQEA